MKERPILFSKPMVLALLAGTKTQTRRIVKPRKDRDMGCALAPHEIAGEINAGNYRNAPWQPGELLWVREAIRLVPDQEPDDGMGRVLSIYDADGWLTPADAWPWKRSYLPPMHCPRGLSRIELEITDVRVERLQEISQADAMAEGSPPSHPSIDKISREFGYEDFPRSWYAQLWDEINGAGSWAANPWVWVISFQRFDEGGAA